MTQPIRYTEHPNQGPDRALMAQAGRDECTGPYTLCDQAVEALAEDAREPWRSRVARRLCEMRVDPPAPRRSHAPFNLLGRRFR